MLTKKPLFPTKKHSPHFGGRRRGAYTHNKHSPHITFFSTPMPTTARAVTTPHCDKHYPLASFEDSAPHDNTGKPRHDMRKTRPGNFINASSKSLNRYIKTSSTCRRKVSIATSKLHQHVVEKSQSLHRNFNNAYLNNKSHEETP